MFILKCAEPTSSCTSALVRCMRRREGGKGSNKVVMDKVHTVCACMPTNWGVSEPKEIARSQLWW